MEIDRRFKASSWPHCSVSDWMAPLRGLGADCSWRV